MSASGLKVLYPYTRRHAPAVAAAPEGAVWVDVSSDDHAYWRVMCEWWEAGEAFAVIEHDVVCGPNVISAFEACPEPWCVFGYSPICHATCQEAWANMLGCTRFSAELIAAVPDAVSSIPEHGHDSAGRLCDLRDWHNLCDSIAGDKIGGMPAPLRPRSVRAAGLSHHWHSPPVRHISWDRTQRTEP